MSQQKRLFLAADLTIQHHRRGKTAQDGRRGFRRKPFESEALLRLIHLKHLGFHNFVAIRVEQSHSNRNDLGILHILPRGGRCVLFERQCVSAVGIVFADREARCAGLRIPQLELAKIAPGRILKNLQPILNRAGLPVVTVEIEVERFRIGLIPYQRFQHPDNLSAFFIDGRGVEVVDFLKAFGSHRVAERALILGELPRAQINHIVNAFDRRSTHIAGELRIAENRQPFF